MLDDMLDLAIDRRQRACQQRHTGGTRRPMGAGEAIRALQAALAGELLGDVELI